MNAMKKTRITAILISISAVITFLLASATVVLAAKLQIADIDIAAQTILEQGTTEAIEVAYTAEGDLPENILQKATKAVPLSWASSDTAVVTVDNCGKLTAVGPGTAEIFVTGQNGALSDSCAVTVTVTPEILTIPDEISLTLHHFNVQNLDAALLPENTTAKVCYASSDETVASVSEIGEVTAIGRGECIIRAWAVDTLTGITYDLQRETKVSVQAVPNKLSLSNATLQLGTTKQMKVSMEPAEVDVGTDYIWTSSNESIATVAGNGTVTAKAVGTTTITVNNELGQRTNCTVTVTGCTYCGATSHTTAYCAKKAIEQRGACGRLRIPSVGVDVAMFLANSNDYYSGRAQAINDAADSGVYYVGNSCTYFTDHFSQAFGGINACKIGTKVYLDRGNTVDTYEVSRIVPSYVNEDHDAPSGLYLYTCNNATGTDIFVAFLSPCELKTTEQNP